LLSRGVPINFHLAGGKAELNYIFALSHLAGANRKLLMLQLAAGQSAE